MARDREIWMTQTVERSIEIFLAKMIELRDGLDSWREGLWKEGFRHSALADNLELASAKLNYAIDSISSIDISSIADVKISFSNIKSVVKSRVLTVVCNMLEVVILLLEDKGLFAEANLMDYVIDELKSFRMPKAFKGASTGGKTR